MKKRTLVIADIHGALKALEQALKRANYTINDNLIFLGDYVDGWSESSELIEYLINLKEVSNGNIIFILGNHDKWCKDWLNTGQTPIIWTQQGGKATVESYIRTGHLVKDSHKEFFNKCLPYYIDEQNRGFVHGGFTSKKGLGHEPYDANYYWDRDLWNLALMTHGRFHEGAPESARRFEKHKEIFIGHTSTFNWKCKPHYPEFEDDNQTIKNGDIYVPMNRCNVWNLDTGAGYKGKVTIMDVDTKEYWQSDYVPELYPNEKGR